MARLRWWNRIAASSVASFALVMAAPAAATPASAEGDGWMGTMTANYQWSMTDFTARTGKPPAKQLQATTNGSPLVIGSLAGVAFPDASNGWAVGAGSSASRTGGLILRTTDGGSSWSQQVVPSNANLLQGVTFVGGSSGWAVGSNTSNGGLVLATVDGGSAWNSQTLPAGVGALSAVTFTSSTTGWAVGGSSIIATTNGGATWTSQTVPLGVAAINGVSFASATTGWAVGGDSGGGVILATTNGGATWARQSTPSGSYVLNSITSTSTTTAWAVGRGPQGVILATTDGGTTWTQQTTPTSSSSLYGVAFSGSAGWAVGGDSNGARIILRTTTGGNAWVQQAPPPSAHSILAAVAATSPTSAVAVGAGDCGSPSVLTTADGGTTWTSRIGQRVAVRGLNAVAFATAVKGWAVGNDTCSSGVVLATQNGGTTWQRQSLPTTVDDLSAVTFSNATTGWAVGNQNHRSPTHAGTTIVATTDGGLTWFEQAHPYLPVLKGVASFGVNLAWATGWDTSGVILATTDGGTTWSKQTVPAGVGTLNAITFVNATTGWAVGTKAGQAGSNVGVILATTDGGATWLYQTPPTGAGPLYGLSFVSAATGWVVGATTSYQAQILATTDGGTTWAAQPPPGAQSQVQAVSFASPAVGWTVGTGISATTDGGRTWLRQAGFPSKYLNGVASSGLNAAWAVGWSSCQQPYGLLGGTIVATTDGGTNWSTEFDDCPKTVPMVTRVAPISGNSTGGTAVTITGTGFTGATGVSFGASAATGFTVNSDTSITATSPAGSAGTVDVTVTNAAGTSASSSADTYVYVPPAISWQQYSLAASNGTTWVPIDSTNLSTTFSAPTATASAILSGNADLWTSLAGVNQDLGILVKGGIYGTAGTVVAWKESGGYAGTFSPNAAFVQTVIPIVGSTQYTAQLVWKSNKATTGTIFAAAGAGPNFSPSRLTVEQVPTPTTTEQSVATNSQYLLAGNNGTAWQDMDATNLVITNFTPAATSTGLVSANADLWTTAAGINQDIGIWISGGTYGSGTLVGWKESGGYGGTFSPNAAYVQTLVSLVAATPYTIRLQWKTNKPTSSTIVAGAGGGPMYSPTRLTLRLFPTANTLVDGSTNKQYNKAGSTGADWTPIDSTGLQITVAPTATSVWVLSANADLWTSTVGVNQDIGIFISGGAFGTGALVAWKESGGYGGTFSPNAAFVQSVMPLATGTTYTITLEWKANKATGGTIFAAAGSGPAPNYSPTRITAQLLG